MKYKYIPYGLHWIGEEDIKEVVKTLRSDWITTGLRIPEFEESMCRYIGCSHAVAVNSGTSAFDIAIASLGMDKGEVITTPFTFVASSNMIIQNGMVPIFADIKSDTFNIDPEEIRKKITPKTKAILYMDYGGHPCNMREISTIAEDNGLYMIEDACHALGAEYYGDKVGNFADVNIFSFHPVKHITTGEGGMAVTGSEDLAEKMRSLRNHGMDSTAREREGWGYDVKTLGKNYRITDFQCSLGISQLNKIEKFLKRREEIAKIYDSAFDNPQVKPNIRHARHLYTILIDKRNEVFTKLRKRRIGVNIHYIPTYRFSYYKRFRINPKDFPVTENIFSRILTIPIFPKMTDEDVSDVIKAIKETT